VNVVVVGAGLAGASAVEELRERGYRGDITLVGAEPHLPYERPPLSKGLLLGSQDVASVFVHDQQWYDERQVDLRLGTAASGLDLEQHRVLVGDDRIPFDRLLLATGATPRRLDLPGAGGIEVVHLRTLDDALHLKDRLSGRILIVGAGWIGLELASAARQAGAEVTVVEQASLPLLPVLGQELAPLIVNLHREHGVDLRLSTGVAGVHGHEVTLSDGHRLRPDLVIVGIGVVPDDRLAAEAGLAVGNGVLVDARLRTDDVSVHVAGDLADHDHPDLGRVRVEHWDNAIQQGRHAARAMLGDDTPYTRLPYFFTDQYDVGMEYIGHVGRAGHDEVIVRGDPGARVITAFWLRDRTVVAGMHLNDWDATEHLRRLVGRRADPRLRDPGTDLADLEAGQASTMG
jgi:3-phenylpropionate/trans-cinnamate dioxygenase ferredoxin reductase component